MNVTVPVDLDAQILRQHERLSETASALAEKFDHLDVRARAESGVTDLLEASTDSEGRPRPAVLVGAAIAVVAVAVVLRRRSRARKAARASAPGATA